MLLEEVLYKRRLLEVLADLVVFSLAYSGAYLLRYDASVPQSQIMVMTHTLALAVACKSAAFGIAGVYRGAWHQISIPDVHRLIRATLLGMVLTVVAIVFAFREAEFSRSIFVLDGLLALLFAVGARVSLRSLDRVRYRLSGVGVRSLIYGAGRGGELLLREIWSNRELDLHPVGLLDDDATKKRRAIHGIPILGGIGEMEKIVKDHSINKVVIATKKLSHDTLQRVSEACRVLGVDLLQLEIELRPVRTRAAGIEQAYAHHLDMQLPRGDSTIDEKQVVPTCDDVAAGGAAPRVE
jgi:UDP-GlcNAc:undecaprenyl-phosphate GlcNAc-1-phosphate transferase